MGRVSQLLAAQTAAPTQEVEQVEEYNLRPEGMSASAWALVMETGELANQRLYEILSSPRFTRLRASDQAKLIALAQNRAYGMPKSNTQADSKKRGRASDVTAAQLNSLVERTTLPEYRRVVKANKLEEPD